MSNLKGCGSHSCAVKPPDGIGTNGPCRCMVSDYRGQSLVRHYKQRIAELEGYERMCKMSGQNIGLRLMTAEEEITRLNVVLDKAQEGTWWDGNEPWEISRLESWLVSARNRGDV